MQFDLLKYRSSYPYLPGYRDKDTSMSAAESIADDASKMRKKVYEVLVRPMTDWEIAEAADLPFESSQPRRSELVASGSVIFSGVYGISPRSGKRVKKWMRS